MLRMPQPHLPAPWTPRDWGRAALDMALEPWSPSAHHPPGAPDDAKRPLRWQNDPFALGVASGQPRADSVVLWTRLLVQEIDAAVGAQPVAVQCEVFADEALRQRVGQWTVMTDAQRGMSVHVEAKGLQPARDYWYRFRCGDALSRVGHTRTARRRKTRSNSCALRWRPASISSRGNTLPTATLRPSRLTSCCLSATTSTKAPTHGMRFGNTRVASP